MAFTLDNQTLLYIILILCVVQFVVMRYYVQSSVDDSISRNNKKITKKISSQIGTTFDKYMGSASTSVHRGHDQDADYQEYEHPPQRRHSGHHRRSRVDEDSIDDPAEDIEEELDPDQEQEESDE